MQVWASAVSVGFKTISEGITDACNRCKEQLRDSKPDVAFVFVSSRCVLSLYFSPVSLPPYLNPLSFSFSFSFLLLYPPTSATSDAHPRQICQVS